MIFQATVIFALAGWQLAAGGPYLISILVALVGLLIMLKYPELRTGGKYRHSELKRLKNRQRSENS